MDTKLSNDLKGIGRELQVLQMYLSDYKGKYHGRLISRKLGIHHRTVSLALKRLEKKDIMKHITVGKNKMHYLNLDNPLTKDYLVNAEFTRGWGFIEKHFIMKKMRIEMAAFLKNTPLIIFGSYAKGEETKESDIDMLLIKDGNNVLKKKLTEFFERHNRKAHIQTVTQKKFEEGLKKKDLLVAEIIKDHVVLNSVPVFIDILWRHYNEIA